MGIIFLSGMQGAAFENRGILRLSNVKELSGPKLW
jgi:hypothetical protein